MSVIAICRFMAVQRELTKAFAVIVEEEDSIEGECGRAKAEEEKAAVVELLAEELNRA